MPKVSVVNFDVVAVRRLDRSKPLNLSVANSFSVIISVLPKRAAASAGLSISVPVFGVSEPTSFHRNQGVLNSVRACINFSSLRASLSTKISLVSDGLARSFKQAFSDVDSTSREIAEAEAQ
jgi:hypothetical protein